MAREIKRRNFITWVTETSDDGLFRVEKGSPIITLGDKSWKVFNFLREYVWGLVESDLKCRNFWRVVVVEEVLEGKYVFVSVETCGLEIAKDECLGAKRLTVRTLLSMLTFFFDQRVERFVADQNMPCYETYLSRANATLYHRIIYDDLHLGTFLLLTHPMFYSEIQFFHLCLKILQIYQDQDNIREYEKDVSMDGTVSDCDDWANLFGNINLSINQKIPHESRSPK
ncbi:hypothetical protein Tsubulata_030151 [Turnera subulata]|uniref:Uncharacterized protein n=1 Tax=Turnera subulata TaxID=218843 RepID=A0A9Q0IZA4_9ROSI|nr:hypothetical protein Tsubulata_030151 [Turnera subulata]